MMRSVKHRPGLSVPSGPLRLMWRMYRNGLPLVDRALQKWRERIKQIPNDELRTQAIASISTKTFHCQGGAVFATLNPSRCPDLVELIVAFQTISDYLDNLCDRSTSMDERDFRQLHQAMIDAATPERTIDCDYYQFRDDRDDEGYLCALVQTCQRILRTFPKYGIVAEYAQRWIALYADLQVFKHLDWSEREQRLLSWWNEHQSEWPELRWNEFAAAAGSTLGVFLMFAIASDTDTSPETVRSNASLYFPWICGLHILLDYFIDQEEDRLGGDLNFCSYYDSPEQVGERIRWMLETATKTISEGNLAKFNRMVIEGLMAVYLSDSKVATQPSVRLVTEQLMNGRPLIRLFFWLNSHWVRWTRPQIRFR